MTSRAMRAVGIVGLLVAGLVVTGCGAHRMTPVDPKAVGTLKPEIEDRDANLVGIAAAFTPKTYTVLVLEPFSVDTTQIKDEEDTRLAKDMSAYLHAQLLKRLQAAAIFARVVDGATGTPPAGERMLRLQGEIPRLTEGNQALRYFVGFGAGAAKAQIETRFVDGTSAQVQMITVDRRAAGMGIFGGDGRQFVTESMDQMAEGLVKLLRHLADGGKPGAR